MSKKFCIFDSIQKVEMILCCLFWASFAVMQFKSDFCILKPGFHYTANATTTTQRQSDYKVEQSSFRIIALF